MPDSIQPVGAMIQPPDPSKGLGMMSSILGIQQQRLGLQQQNQALQTGQYQQQTAQAESSQAQQKNAELQAVGNLTKQAYQSGRYKAPDGSFDNQKFANDVAQVAPTYGQGIANDATSRAGEVYRNGQTLFNLESSKRQQLGDTLGALAGNQNVTQSDVIDAFEGLRQQHPDDKALSRMLQSTQGSIPPSTTGPQLQQVLNTMASAATAHPSVSGTTNAASQIVNRGTYSGQLSPQTGDQSINPGAPKVAAQTAQGLIPPANQAGLSTNDVTRYSQIGQEGTNAQTGVQLAKQVSQLSDQVRTGQLSKEWADRLAVLKQNDPNITNRQMLSKYAAQLKTMATQGAATDASRSQIDEGMPSPESMDPAAVKQAAQYVGGIFGMRGARQSVADQYVKRNGNAIGIQGVDNEFMRAADPTLFAYKSLPQGPERQAFLKAHNLTTPEAQQEFKARMNQVNHYSGGQ